MAQRAPGARGPHGQLSPHLLCPRSLHQDSRPSGRTLQGIRICLPKAHRAALRTAAWSCHGPPASSAGSKGTARCNQDSPPHSVPGHLSTSPADKRENSSLAYSRVLSEQWCLAAGGGSAVRAVLHVPSKLGSRVCPSEGFSSLLEEARWVFCPENAEDSYMLALGDRQKTAAII